MENLGETYMAIMAERDAALQERDIAIQERNVAISERKKALAEQDMAILERDAAITERNAILEWDNGVASFNYLDINNLIPASPQSAMPHKAKHRHHQQHMHHLPHMVEPAYFPMEVPFCDALLSSTVASATATKKVKQSDDAAPVSVKKSSKVPKLGKRQVTDLREQARKRATIDTSNGWESKQDLHGSEGESNKQLDMSNHGEKNNLGLNQLNFDESKKSVPVCFCSEKVQNCRIPPNPETEGDNHPTAGSPCQ